MLINTAALGAVYSSRDKRLYGFSDYIVKYRANSRLYVD